MSEIKKIISENINKYLIKADMKKSDLALKLDIHKSSVGTWCNGTTSPALDIIPELCSALGITINELFSLPSDVSIDSNEWKLLELYRNNDAEVKEAIITILKKDIKQN